MHPRADSPGGLLALLLPVLLFALWWAATRNAPDGLIPQPAQVAAGDRRSRRLRPATRTSFSGQLWINLLASAERVYGGFARCPPRSPCRSAC